jgi:hypothetical protein
MTFGSLAITCTAAVVLCAAGASPADAQTTLGVKAGVSGATISVGTEADSVFDPRQQRGLVGGAAVLLPGNRIGGVQIEALVHQKGGQDVLRRDDRLRLTYLEIPVLLHADVLQRGRSAVFVTFGPSFGFNLDASYEDEGVTEDIGRDIRTFDPGLNLGAGVEAGPLVVEARYTWGLRSAFTGDDPRTTFKNRALAVTVGVWLR